MKTFSVVLLSAFAFVMLPSDALAQKKGKGPTDDATCRKAAQAKGGSQAARKAAIERCRKGGVGAI